MTTTGVSWQRVLLAMTAVAVALTGVIVAFRADGFPAVDATVPRATRWFFDQTTGRIVLADGFSGRTLARLDTAEEGDVVELAQSASGAVVVDRSDGSTRAVDASALRLGPPQSLGLVAEPTALVGVSPAGIVAVEPTSAQALLLPPGGDAIPFEFDAYGAGADTQIAPDGAIWTIAAGRLTRVTTADDVDIATGLSDARFSLVGGTPLLFDSDRARVRFGRGRWVDLPAGVAVSEVVLQESGPSAGCGWIAADDRLWCIGEGGIQDEVTIAGLDVDGADLLAIAGDAAALVRRSPSEIVRLDVRSRLVIDGPVADPSPGASLSVAATTDLIWIDETNGRFVWAVNPWGISAIEKDDSTPPLLGGDGELIAEGEEGGDVPSVRGGDDTTEGEREPDGDAFDDPPIAVDDPVTARSGTSVPIAVTANDWDPDGEAIAIKSVGEAGRGSIEIATASTVVYQPEPGYVGLDEFRYTIVDGNGTEASATVFLELLPADAPNQAPIGAPDSVETGPDAAVVIDVLANDIDPERDSLRVASFSAPDVGGTITETQAPSGLPALRYEPDLGESGTATFTYRPVDSFGAVGEAVPVRIEIAQATDENREPVAKPDAVRVRRNVPAEVNVLANDRDPDGDRLLLGLVGLPPPGIDVEVEGDTLVVIARAGAAEFSPFTYSIDDGNGHRVNGSVLVALIADDEPNRPPVANADTASAVVGRTQTIDVLANDSDPDGDPLVLLDVDRSTDSPNAGVIEVQGNVVRYTAAPIVTDDDVVIDRFTYSITDGNQNTVTGEVSVRVLREAIAAPPFARDDAATTEVDVPVTLDVLRNDGDPSGEPPTIAGTPGCLGGGVAVLTADERVTFTPPPGQSGVFTCSYEVTNSTEQRASATIVVSVVEPPITNRPPEVTGEEIRIVKETSRTINLLANDTDPDGDRLQVLSSTRPTLGTASREGGVIRFDAGSVIGPTVITYTVGDGRAVSTGQLLIIITEPEQIPPFAVDDIRTITGPATPTRIDVLANDGDPDGDDANLRLVSASLVSGSATVATGARSVTLTPPPDFVGAIAVSYTVQDEDGLTAVGRVQLTVLQAPNRPPIARADAAQVVNGGTVTVPIALNDADPDGDPLTYTIVSGAAGALGVARLELGALVFEAEPGASGIATVTYQVDDGEALAQAQVAITVLPCASAPPEAPDLFFQTGYQQPIAIDLTAAARNGVVVAVGAPLGVPSGVYTPPAGENGNVTFTYSVRNSCRITDVGQVVIDVNQDPLATPFRLSIGRIDRAIVPVTSLATDAEPLQILALEGAPEWIGILEARQSFVIEPGGRSGRVDFSAVVADPGGLQTSVPVTIELVNLAPVAQPDSVAIADGPVVFNPLVNDRDPDGDTITLASVPANVTFPNGGVGTITRLGNGDLSIAAGSGLGVATFTYTVVDALGLPSAPATVTVTVNRSPVAPAVEFAIRGGDTITVAVPATDAEGGPLTLQLVGPTDPLTITVAGLELTVTAPNNAGDGTVVVPYSVTDPQGATSGNTLTIDIVRRPPPTTTTTSTTTTSTTTTTTTTTTTVPPTTSTTTTSTTTTSTTSSTSTTSTTSTTAPPTTAP